VADVLIRPLEPGDIGAAYALLSEWQAEVGEAVLTLGMFSNLQQIAACAFVAETEDGVVGHAHMRADDINVLVHGPERRRGIGTSLVRACEARADGNVVSLFGVATEAAAAPFAAAMGYSKVWEVWLMGVDLPERPDAPAWPDGTSVRTFADDDAPAVKDLLDTAYAEEPGHVPLPYEDWRTFMLGDPSFDAEAWFLAFEGDRLVGAVLNWKEGYVKDLVVHPDRRGRGLGKALMLQAFAEFARRGIPRLTLKTDSINPTDAWRLYEGLGMRKERTYEVFEKRV
jgi:mycothiol synthase